MTVHKFPVRSTRNRVADIGLSDIPFPPAYAIRDMQAAHNRFFHVLALDLHWRDMPRPVLEQAKSDVRRWGEYVRYTEIDGIRAVATDALARFVHYVTGHPRAWILAWQAHDYANSIEAFGTACSEEQAVFEEHVKQTLQAFNGGFNREF